MEVKILKFAALIFTLTLLSCGGSGGSGGSVAPIIDPIVETPDPIIDPIVETPDPTPLLEVSPGGIWVTQSLSLEPRSTLYIDESGKLILEQISISANFDPITGEFFPDTGTGYLRYGFGQVLLSTLGEITGTYDQSEITIGQPVIAPAITPCDLTGILIERAALNVSLSCTDVSGTNEVQMINFVPSPDCISPFCPVDEFYDIPSSLDRIAGDYSYFIPIGSSSISISPAGVVSGTFNNGVECEVSGSVSIIDDNFNLYNIEWTFSNCVPAISGQSGRSVEGFMLLQGNEALLSTTKRLRFLMSTPDFVAPNFMTGTYTEIL